MPILSFRGSRPGHFKELRTGDAPPYGRDKPPPSAVLRSFGAEPGGPPFRNTMK